MENYALKRNRGQAVLILVIILLFAIMASIGVVGPLILDSYKITLDRSLSKRVVSMAETGAEDMTYRILNGLSYDSQEIIQFDNGQVNISINEDTETGVITIYSRGVSGEITRTKEVRLARGTNSYIEEAVQSGGGGVALDGTSEVNGDIYSDGPVIGSGNDVGGDVTSAGDQGLVKDLNILGDATAETISGAIVDGDAMFAENLVASLVEGSSLAGALMAVAKPLPIQDEHIDDWKDAAEDGNVINTCPYVISGGAPVVLGPTVINCDVLLSGNADITLAGPVWVKGDIIATDNTSIRIDANLDCRSVALIADNPSNYWTGSTISIGGDVTIVGSLDVSCLGKSFIAL